MNNEHTVLFSKYSFLFVEKKSNLKSFFSEIWSVKMFPMSTNNHIHKASKSLQIYYIVLSMCCMKFEKVECISMVQNLKKGFSNCPIFLRLLVLPRCHITVMSLLCKEIAPKKRIFPSKFLSISIEKWTFINENKILMKSRFY